MAENAAHLVDNVFPDQPLRQWVLSFPYNLRYLFAYNKKALHQALQVMIRVISAYYRKKGKEKYGIKGKTGAVTLIQRFGGHCNLHPHFHVLFIDGVFDDKGKFHRIMPPTDEEVAELVVKLKTRVFRSLEKKGYIDGYNINYDGDELYNELPGLAEILLSSLQNRIYFGDKRGEKGETVGSWGTGKWAELKGNRCAYKDGFSLHANVYIGPNDIKGREHLCRYITRPPIANERLKEDGDGNYIYNLKKACFRSEAK
jgi:hypothetical protein